MIGQLTCYVGQQAGFFLVIAPSINTIGRGNTEQEAWKDFDENVRELLNSLTGNYKEPLLLALGETFDEDGLLECFNFPAEVKKCIFKPSIKMNKYQ